MILISYITIIIIANINCVLYYIWEIILRAFTMLIHLVLQQYPGICTITIAHFMNVKTEVWKIE